MCRGSLLGSTIRLVEECVGECVYVQNRGSTNICWQARKLMVDIMTLNGSQSVLDASEIAALRSGLRGAVLLSGDEGYETARRVWNGNVDKRPAVIVRCMS